MLTTVRGSYDGRQIVVDELDRAHLRAGDRVIITVLPEAGAPKETGRKGPKGGGASLMRKDMYAPPAELRNSTF